MGVLRDVQGTKLIENVQLTIKIHLIENEKSTPSILILPCKR
jgi:hypothetical protein